MISPLFFRLEVLEPIEEAADAPRPLCAVVPGPGGAEV